MAITFTPRTEIETVTIAEAASLSSAADLMGSVLVGIVMPAAWTAANLTFQASANGTIYNNLYDDSGNEVGATAAVDRFIAFDSNANFQGVRWVKVRSGTSGAAVTQAAIRTLTLVARAI